MFSKKLIQKSNGEGGGNNFFSSVTHSSLKYSIQILLIGLTIFAMLSSLVFSKIVYGASFSSRNQSQVEFVRLESSSNTPLNTNSEVNSNVQNSNNIENSELKYSGLVQLGVEYEDNTKIEDVKKVLNNLDFSQIALETWFNIGNITQTEFIARTSAEFKTANLDNEIKTSRINFLENMQNIEDSNSKNAPNSDYEIKEFTSKSSSSAIAFPQNKDIKDDLNKQKFSKLDINVSLKEVKTLAPNFTKSKIVLDKAKAEKFKTGKDIEILDKNTGKTKDSKLSKIKSLQIREIKAGNKTVNRVNTSKQDDTVAFADKAVDKLANFANMLGSVNVNAQSSTPSWVPKESETYFFDSDEWRSLNRSTKKTYSVTGYRDNLCVSHNGYYNSKVYYSCSIYGDVFSNWIEAPGDTTDAPVIFSAFNRLYQMMHGIDDGIYIRYNSGNYDEGWLWTPWKRLPGLTTSTPAMGFTGNKLCLMHRGTSNGIYQACSSDGWNFPSWVETGGLTTDAPVMTYSNGRLYQGHRGTSNNLYTRFSTDNGQSFTGWRDTGRTSDQSFAMTNFNIDGAHNLCLLHKGNGQDRSMYQGCTKDGINWGGWYRISGETLNAPATIQTLGKLWWAHKGTDNNMYLKYSNTGASTRGYYSYMLWDTKFGDFDGYEQDIKLSNVEENQFKTYLTKANKFEAPTCEPLIKYASSSLPDAYLDTRLDFNGVCDNYKGEISYTIGTGWAGRIPINIWQANYYETMKGERDKPVFTVQAQKMAQIPTGCGNSWCLYPRASCNYIDYDPQINRDLTFPYWKKTSNQYRTCKS